MPLSTQEFIRIGTVLNETDQPFLGFIVNFSDGYHQLVMRFAETDLFPAREVVVIEGWVCQEANRDNLNNLFGKF